MKTRTLPPADTAGPRNPIRVDRGDFAEAFRRAFAIADRRGGA